jgi:hypothetical protein
MAHLISDISEVQEYVKVNNGLSFQSLLPAINEVEMGELRYYLGQTLLNTIISEKNAETYTGSNSLIAPHIIAACACLAVYKSTEEIELQVSDTGITRQETNNEKTAFGGQVKRFKDLAGSRGYKAIDNFLALLEDDPASFPDWASSPYYSDKAGLLVRSVTAFETAGESLKGSSLTFRSLIPIMKDIQNQRLAGAFPDGMFQAIMDNIGAETPNADYDIIVNNYLRPALVKLTMEEALTTLPVSIDHQGVFIDQVALQGDARTLTSAPISLIEKKAWGLRGRGEFYLANMKEYLNGLASDSKFPLWYASNFYTETLAKEIERESIHPHDRRIYRV